MISNDQRLVQEFERRLGRARRLGIIDAGSARFIRNSADVDNAETCPHWRGGACPGCDIDSSFDLSDGGIFRLTAEGLLEQVQP